MTMVSHPIEIGFVAEHELRETKGYQNAVLR